MKEIKEKIEDLTEKFHHLSSRFDIEGKRKELKELENKLREPGFWQKEKNAREIQKRFSQLKEELVEFERLEKEISNLEVLLPLIKEGSKEKKEIEENIAKLTSEIEIKSREFYLSGKYDKNSAILNIFAGAGGRDAEDWTALLLRMYQRWSERNNFQTKILYRKFGEAGGPEGRIGLKEASMEIKGRFAYGLLKKESGVHRLVRISPFSAKGLRHTSFSKIEVLPKIEKEEEAEIEIRPEDLKIETFRASGPGGQYVNRRESAVRITHLPTGLQVASQAERLQGLNKKIAMGILKAKLLQLQEKEREKEFEKIKGRKVAVEFGSQIRSYVFHPYRLVKDHRTGVETSDVESVLDGDLNKFITAEIKI